MSTMKITMLGLQNALTWRNKSLFDNLNLPSGIDRDTVIDNILLEGGDFEVLYADPYFMRAAIGTWSSKHYRTFEKWINALNLDYNPLENYDRQEDWTDTLDSDTTNNSTDNTSETNTTTVNSSTSTEGSESDNGSVENTVSAFDSNSYQPSDKSTSDNSTSTTTESSSNTYSNAGLTHQSTVTDTGTKDDTSVHTGRVHGNIGVTTSQQMLQSELDIAKFNIVQQITDLFISEFCIMIYT